MDELTDAMVVDAFVAYLAEQRNPGLQVESRPDVTNRSSADIDAIAGPFAIEHTSIDTIENQRRDGSWFGAVAEHLEEAFRGDLNCRLRLIFPYEGVSSGQDWRAIREALESWIAESASTLPDGVHTAHVSGVPFEVSLGKESHLIDGHIVDAVSIRERPAAVEDRAVPGHWEGDLLVGARKSYIATLVERRSRYVCLVRVSGKATRTVVRALTRHVQRLPAGLMATLTWDRGLELAAHRSFSIATGVQVYFCDPQSPWQRGTNENTNGLLRQYFPKGTDLSGYSQRYLDAIALRLNTRPRKTLGYRTPAVTLAETVASTA